MNNTDYTHDDTHGNAPEQRTPEWFAQRIGMITGSRIGALLGLSPYQTRDDLMRAMVREYHGAESEFKANPATEWGTLNEEVAKAEYVFEINTNEIFDYNLDELHLDGDFVEVTSAPFIVSDEYAFLGASPDGFIGENGLIEIKCPYGLRNKLKDELQFKSIHEQPHYYAQIQLQLFVTERKWCHFFQWAPTGFSLQVVEVSKDWIYSAMPQIESFMSEFLHDVQHPAKHLAPRRVQADSLEHLVTEYMQLGEVIDEATARRKEIIAELEDLTGGKDSEIAGHKFTHVERKGAVDYSKVPELKGLDLEQYRKAGASYWTLR